MHDTYLNGHAKGWPHDHTAEDTFELPPKTTNEALLIKSQDEAKEYRAEFGTDGSARLYLHTPPKLFIATFETFADAKTAAEALNNHKGY